MGSIKKIVIQFFKICTCNKRKIGSPKENWFKQKKWLTKKRVVQ